MRLDFPLILASGSVIRKQMLEEAGVAFTVSPVDVDEDALREKIQALPVPEQALQLAHAKGEAASDRHPDAYVLAADQMCELEGAVLTKPGTPSRAISQLQRMRGKTHFQHSAACLLRNGKMLWETVETASLTMRELEDSEIISYIQRDKPFACCGSYRLEANGRGLFLEINGQSDVIQGLPLRAFLTWCKANCATISSN